MKGNLLKSSFAKIAFGFLCLLGIHGCGGENPSTNSDAKNERLARITSPKGNINYLMGEKINLDLAVITSDSIESITLYCNSKTLETGQQSIVLTNDDLKLGKNEVAYTITTTSGKKESRKVDFRILTKKEPKLQSFKVLSTFNHDEKAYTQGLVWHNGFLYEGTGQRGQSTVRKVDLATGEVLKKQAIDKALFGEGITIWNDKIVQLTWTANTGFVYDVNTFEQQQTFTYSTPGWGITHNGEQLIMSDGTANLYFLDPQTFKVEKTMEVQSNQGPLKNLNELEYINGEIWANIYTTMQIARIDAKTGEVNAIINLRGIVDEADIHAEMDVLNGIAFNEGNGNIYVTGKNWKRLYQIEVADKN